MRVTLTVDAGGGRGGAGASDDLYRWLRQEPELRALVRREPAAPPPDGAMGALGELVSLLLAPGGPTAALGAAVVVWLQNRRGNQTVTITLPDGTQVVVSSEKVRGLTAEGTSELAERVAEAIRQQGAPDGQQVSPDQQQGSADQQQGSADQQPGSAGRASQRREATEADGPRWSREAS